MLIPAVFASLVVALAAALISRANLVRNHRVELEELEDDMTAAVEERYEAYVQLESTVRRILSRLDQHEAETAERLTRTGIRLNDLGRALVACDSGPAAEGADTGVQTVPPRPIELLDPHFEVRPAGTGKAVDITQWQGRLESLASQKKNELERQERLIAELAARLESLQGKLNEREQAFEADNGSGVAQIAQEVQIWRARHLALEQETALELAAVRAQAETAGGLEREVERAHQTVQALEAELETLRERHAESSAAYELRLSESDAREAESFDRHAHEVRALEARIDELTPLVLREEELAARVTQLERTCEQQHLRQEALGAEFDRERAGLQGELVATREARSAERKTFERRIDELERLGSELQVQLEGARARAEELQGRLEARDGELATLSREREQREQHVRELEQVQEDLEVRLVELRTQAEELETARARLGVLEARCTELEVRCAEREEELAALAETNERGAERQAELTRENGRLAAELEEARGQIQRWQDATREAEAARDAQMNALGQQFAALEEVSASLREAAEEHLGRIAELEDREQLLERSLEQRNGELGRTTERLQDAERTLQAAFALLAQAKHESD